MHDNNIHFRSSYLTEVKHLKLIISHLNKQLESLGRNQNLCPPKSEDIITVSSSPIQSTEYGNENENEEIRFRPEAQNKDIVIVTSTPIHSSQLQAEIEEYLNLTSESWGEMI